MANGNASALPSSQQSDVLVAESAVRSGCCLESLKAEYSDSKAGPHRHEQRPLTDEHGALLFWLQCVSQRTLRRTTAQPIIEECAEEFIQMSDPHETAC